MRSLHPLIACFLGLTTGCSLLDSIEHEPQTNTCETSADCGSGSSCVDTAAGASICVANEGSLGAVILEVRLTGGTQASYLFYDTFAFDGGAASGHNQSVEITLPSSVPVTGSLTSPNVTMDECRADDGTLPVNVTFHRRAQGGPFKFDVTASSPALAEESATAAFTAEVPPGAYDVYLAPKTVSPLCTQGSPPRLLTDVRVQGDAYEIVLPEEPHVSLTGTLIVPNGAGVEGWILDIVDPTYGHPISDALTLEAGSGQIAIEQGELRYHPVPNALLRLRDPAGDLAVHWVLSVLDLNLDDHVEVDLSDLAAVPMPLQATVIDEMGKLIPDASVDIRSVSLTGSANQNATYRAKAMTNAAGIISAKLIPGSYVVTIVPQGPGSAPLVDTWEITAGGGGSGKGFMLPQQPRVRGHVADTTGTSLASAPVVVGPVRTLLVDYFSQSFDKPDPALPSSWPTRPQAGTTSSAGGFDIPVDPGEVNLLVQMPSESGYPWFVLPRFLVNPPEEPRLVDVGDLTLRHPLLAQGRILTSASSPVASAVVRAWVQPRDGDNVGPLVQIGQATTSGDGVFVLPLPQSITLPAAEPNES